MRNGRSGGRGARTPSTRCGRQRPRGMTTAARVSGPRSASPRAVGRAAVTMSERNESLAVKRVNASAQLAAPVPPPPERARTGHIAPWRCSGWRGAGRTRPLRRTAHARHPPEWSRLPPTLSPHLPPATPSFSPPLSPRHSLTLRVVSTSTASLHASPRCETGTANSAPGAAGDEGRVVPAASPRRSADDDAPSWW